MDLTTWLRAQWDRAIAIALVLLGALALLFGWIGVSGTAYLAEQLPYVVSAGLFGIFLLGIGATVWISADLRDEWRKLDRIEQLLRTEQRPESEAEAVGDVLHAPAAARPRRPRVATAGPVPRTGG